MIVEDWGFKPEWLEYVISNHQGRGRVELVNDGSTCRLDFLEKARDGFLRNGFTVKQMKTYVSVQKPSELEGYAEGYPHIHYPTDGVTLIHYLQPGDVPAPLHVFIGNEVVEEIVPVAGKTVYMPHNVKHGVMQNKGTIDRVQFIATALPR